MTGNCNHYNCEAPVEAILLFEAWGKLKTEEVCSVHADELKAAFAGDGREFLEERVAIKTSPVLSLDPDDKRFDPENGHGAGDGFGGSDFP